MSATAYERLIDALADRVARANGTQAYARCPAHDDHNPSLSITAKEGSVLVCCQTGCHIDDVLAAISWTKADLYDRRDTAYTYPDGRIAHRSYGTDGRKRFWQTGNTKPDGKAALYRLDKVKAAVAAGNVVFVVEGEEDVHSLEALGVVATCNPMGARKWDKIDPSPLYGGNVLIIADQDEPGRKHAAEVLASLTGKARAAVFSPKTGKDASDHVAHGYGTGEFIPGDGSAVSTSSAGFSERGPGEPAGTILDDTRAWFARFVRTMDDLDLDLFTLWAAHTWLAMETYTTPRLVLDSPVPGSGKTTVLEHLFRLCIHPVQMASVGSPALLTRMLQDGIRTVLIDEADRSLDPKKEGVGELLAVLNSGYKRGATRPVLVPAKNGGWETAEMPTFSPVAMAGNNPNLPEDTKSRAIRVVLLPDLDGEVEDSDWEEIEAEAEELGAALASWAESVRDQVRTSRPPLPAYCRGRFKERWAPLMRIAAAVGPVWLEACHKLLERDKEMQAMDREDGLTREKPAVTLIRDLRQIWDGETFMSTDTIIHWLIKENPGMWSAESQFGKALTVQRLGRMLAGSYGVHSGRELDEPRRRGYFRAALAPAMRRMGMPLPDHRPSGSPSHPPEKPAEQAEQPEPTAPTRYCATCREPIDPFWTEQGITVHPGCEGGTP